MIGIEGAAGGSTEHRCARLERCRLIIAEALRRHRLTDAEVARELGLDRSYLGKVRRGERPLSEATLDQLIDLLRLDRRRLAMAVDVMEEPELYWDATFRNICYYAETIVTDVIAMTRAGGEFDRGIVLAALPRERCEALARNSVARLAEQFAALDPFLATIRSAR